ncbi:hypothetical protein [Butyrivibrio sp. MB2005]|uniref:hypothetical protein n=1 Tax=Butyrivibrio sp. MB2005 TaxID=1280678 RepID=UPI0003FC91BB|nr:hypothetical protein [Butyrivibrio sp. MB2005]
MALQNLYKFARTVIDADKLLEAFHNEMLVVACRDYSDKKGVLKDGKTLTLQVLYDDTDYGINKKTGKPIQDNVMQNFDVTVLGCDTDFQRGDKVALFDFDEEHSYYIDNNLILRFNSCKKLSSTGASGGNAPSVPTGSAGALSKGLGKLHA